MATSRTLNHSHKIYIYVKEKQLALSIDGDSTALSVGAEENGERLFTARMERKQGGNVSQNTDERKCCNDLPTIEGELVISWDLFDLWVGA